MFESHCKMITDEEKMYLNLLIEDREESAKVLEKESIRGVKKSITEKYSQQAHFVYELLQNADDAKATKCRFILNKDGLIFAHNGSIHFSVSDPKDEKAGREKGKLGHINSITSIGNTSKTEFEIGKFGIGFKSVFQYTETPHIYDHPFNFKIIRFIVPELLDGDYVNRKKGETLFYFPFDRDLKPKDKSYEEVNDRLNKLDHPLLFLKNLNEINWENDEGNFGVYLKETEFLEGAKQLTLIQEVNKKSVEETFLLFEKEVTDNEQNNRYLVSIVFVLTKGKKTLMSPVKKFPAYCFFPTRESTNLKFIVQAPFLLTDSRESIKQGDKWNEYLINQIGDLVADSLPRIRDLNYLDINCLQSLPILKEDFADDFTFYPIYKEVLNKLKSDEKLLPASDGSVVNAKQSLLARGKGLVELLNTEQLSSLFGMESCKWLDSNITDNSPLWNYLTNEIGIHAIRPENIADKLTKEFLEKQDDSWIIKFYGFLGEHNALWRKDWNSNGPLRYMKFIRLENNRHVAPFKYNDKPQVYMPVEGNSSFLTVKRIITENELARDFLEDKLRLTKPDEMAEVIEHILPKYQKEKLPVTAQENIEDIKKIIHIARRISSDRKYDLNTAIEKSSFLIGFNPSTNKKCWCKPDEVYLNKLYTGEDNLDIYFNSNPNVFFLDKMYQDFGKEDFLNIGCLTKIRVKCKGSYGIGFVSITDCHGYHKRGLFGFDPDSEIDGLEYALSHINLDRAKLIWEILKNYSNSIYGTIESCSRQDYVGSKKEQCASKMGELVHKYPWLSDRHDTFHKPDELLISELHDDFDKESIESKNLIEKLGVKKDIEREYLSKIPEDDRKKFELVKNIPYSELEEIISKRDKEKINEGSKKDYVQEIFSFHEEINNFFNSPSAKALVDDGYIHIDDVANTDRRREVTQNEIIEAVKHEPPISERYKRVSIKKWTEKNKDTRYFLEEQYHGKCQICGYTFIKRDGKPYFEGLYMVSRTKAEWIDRPGAVICLCANCCAKFEHGEIIIEDGVVVELIAKLKCHNEGGNEDLSIRLRLCGEPINLRFSERHLIDLQEMIKADEKNT